MNPLCWLFGHRYELRLIWDDELELRGYLTCARHYCSHLSMTQVRVVEVRRLDDE